MCNTCEELETKIEELEKEFDLLKDQVSHGTAPDDIWQKLYLISYEIQKIKELLNDRQG